MLCYYLFSRPPVGWLGRWIEHWTSKTRSLRVHSARTSQGQPVDRWRADTDREDENHGFRAKIVSTSQLLGISATPEKESISSSRNCCDRCRNICIGHLIACHGSHRHPIFELCMIVGHMRCSWLVTTSSGNSLPFSYVSSFHLTKEFSHINFENCIIFVCSSDFFCCILAGSDSIHTFL